MGLFVFVGKLIGACKLIENLRVDARIEVMWRAQRSKIEIMNGMLDETAYLYF